jgi:broad specificity phosphatase PhoE
MRTLLGLATVLLVGTPPAAGGAAETYPARILIIRHAEKADNDSVDLSEKGKQRARALPDLFKKSERRRRTLPSPDFIFATKDSKESHRPRETVKPLAKRLGLKINDDYANKDFAKLAHALLHDPRYAGKTVLICWHHGTIPELAAKLQAPDAPRHWEPRGFDRVWSIDYDKTGKATFHDLPQGLLTGDSVK